MRLMPTILESREREHFQHQRKSYQKMLDPSQSATYYTCICIPHIHMHIAKRGQCLLIIEIALLSQILQLRHTFFSFNTFSSPLQNCVLTQVPLLLVSQVFTTEQGLHQQESILKKGKRPGTTALRLWGILFTNRLSPWPLVHKTVQFFSSSPSPPPLPPPPSSFILMIMIKLKMT